MIVRVIHFKNGFYLLIYHSSYWKCNSKTSSSKKYYEKILYCLATQLCRCKEVSAIKVLSNVVRLNSLYFEAINVVVCFQLLISIRHSLSEVTKQNINLVLQQRINQTPRFWRVLEGLIRWIFFRKCAWTINAYYKLTTWNTTKIFHT